mmetsp:Transcript_22137/g.62269  ORF Transcript_22137/g.62269 Transcript_22137/m.62269 type:complete len:257 (-) Transcript_22137:1354-2124(-)
MRGKPPAHFSGYTHRVPRLSVGANSGVLEFPAEPSDRHLYTYRGAPRTPRTTPRPGLGRRRSRPARAAARRRHLGRRSVCRPRLGRPSAPGPRGHSPRRTIRGVPRSISPYSFVKRTSSPQVCSRRRTCLGARGTPRTSRRPYPCRIGSTPRPASKPASAPRPRTAPARSPASLRTPSPRSRGTDATKTPAVSPPRATQPSRTRRRPAQRAPGGARPRASAPPPVARPAARTAAPSVRQTQRRSPGPRPRRPRRPP